MHHQNTHKNLYTGCPKIGYTLYPGNSIKVFLWKSKLKTHNWKLEKNNPYLSTTFNPENLWQLPYSQNNNNMIKILGGEVYEHWNNKF